MATLPKFLYGTYKRYKADTTSFLDWLVETAKKCGHDTAFEQQTTKPKKAKKGKKSKAAAELTKYTITLKQLSALTQAVSDSGLEVPRVILATARRAISLRKRCAEWFSSGKKAASTDPDSHSHFITVLEEICELLERKRTRSKPSSKQTAAEENSTLASEDADMLEGNQFALLNLEETAAEDSNAATSMPSKQIEIEEDESDDDDIYSLMFFNLYCLFEDLANMREFVSQSVQEYADGKIDLMNVAVVADTAVHLAKQLIDEAVAAWPQLQKQQDIQGFLYVTACFSRGEHPESKPDPSMLYNSNMADVATWCYLPTTVLLTSFRDVLHPNQLPVFKKGHFGTYDPSARRDRMSTSAKFNEDKIILLELLPEFALIAKCRIAMPVQDEITRALVDFTRTKDVPVSLCFASQILLDVHHGLRNTKSRAYNDLRLSGMRISKTIDEYWEFSKTFTGKPRFWPKEGDNYIRDLQGSINAWITDDVFINGKKKVLSEFLLKAGGMEKHFLLRSHGILCGLTMFHFTLRMQHISLQLVNQWYDIPQMAYLYNIIQQTGLKGLSWPDMDAFIEMHGEEHIFIGGRPENADDSMKKLCLATGIRSPSDFAPNNRNRSGNPSPIAKSRLMEPSAAVANIFHDRYLTNGISKISVDNIDKLMKEISYGDPDASPDQQLVTASTQLLQQRWNNSHRLGALQLLVAIKQGMYHEEPRLQFNYFGMHKRCIELFRSIQAKEDHKFKQYFTAGYMPDDTMIGNLVILILTVAQRSGQASQQLGIQQPGGSRAVGSRIVVSCEEVMGEFLETNGDKACKELKTFCKNKSLSDVKGLRVRAQENAYWFSMEEVLDPTTLAAIQTGSRT